MGGGFDGDLDGSFVEEEGEADKSNSDFPLLSRLELPVFMRPREDTSFDKGKVYRQNVLREIVELKEEYSEPLSFEGVNSRVQSTVVRLSQHRRSDELQLDVDRVMKKLFEGGGEHHEVIAAILDYLGRSHSEQFTDGLVKAQLAPRLMDEWDMAATMIHANMEIGQWREVLQALKFFTGLKRVCVGEGKWRKLGEGAGTVHRGEWLYDPTEAVTKKNKSRKVSSGKLRPEKISYWWKSPVEELCRNANMIVNGNKLDPANIEFVQVVNGGDHGKQKFRFTTVKLIVKMRGGRYFDSIYPLADVLCKKDSGIILKNTILPEIDDGINAVADGILHFYLEGGQWQCTLDPSTLEDVSVVEHLVRPCSYLCGDLAFLCMLLGKEGYEKDWCYLCRLFTTMWQGVDHDRGEEWTIESIAQQANVNAEKKHKGVKMMGVKERPYLRRIPVSRTIFSVLHAMMGIGNDGMDFLVDFMESEVEDLPQEEVGLRTEIDALQLELTEARLARDFWDASEEGKLLATLGNKIRYHRGRVERGVGDIERHEQTANAHEATKEKLMEVRKSFVHRVDSASKQLRACRAEVKQFRSDRKLEEGSLYSKVDRILEKYGIVRSAYHSGQINGVGIKLLMDNAGSIMAEVEQIMLDMLPSNESPTAEKVKKTCTALKHFFILWDDSFSAVHKADPTEQDCLDAQEKIDRAMKQMRSMGMAVTPKAHGMEDHVVNQMRSTPGGIVRMIEHWVERYHQVGFRYDDKWQNLKGEERKAKVRSHREHIAANADVIRRLNALAAHCGRRGKRKATIVNEDARKKSRNDYRAEAVAEWLETNADEAGELEAWLEPDEEDNTAAGVLMKLQGSV